LPTKTEGNCSQRSAYGMISLVAAVKSAGRGTKSVLEEKCVQNFSRKTLSKETICRIQKETGRYYYNKYPNNRM